MTTRHLYNNTDGSWGVQFSGGSLPDLPGAQQEGEWWTGTIAPHQSCSLEFDANQGTIDLASPTGNLWSWGFETGTFASDPSWSHFGTTTGARLNDPADGDLQIDQDVPQDG